MINLDNLTEQEKQAVLKILKEYSETGKSEYYNKLLLQDYKEIPVDIITFIKDKKYLGNAWHSADGKCKLYPFWEEKLKQLFPDPFTTNYNNLIESGARGLGKSEIAVTCMLYLMHRLMCLKNPHEYLNLKPTEKVCFAFMNITMTLAEDIANSKFQETVKLSDWFLARGTLSGRGQQKWSPPNFIDIVIGSQSSHVLGLPIYCAFLDEISFIKNQDLDKQKKIATDMLDTAMAGMKTRFIYKGKNPTLMILASSKKSEKSFLETHMKKKIDEEDETSMIIDEPVWNVKPPETYSGKKFYVGQGNRFLVSEIINDENDIKAYRDKGYKILEVPIEFKPDFKDDIDRALCDFAGVSSSDLVKYISGARFSEVKTKNYVNPFVKDIITVGNAPDDNTQYYDFFDLSKIPEDLKLKPLFIHLDMSISGDRTGIAGTWILGKKHSANNESASQELYFQTAFGVAVQAPKGYQVSFAKNREFIYWLKENGFNIKGLSSDTFQNASLAQDFISKGYPYEIISVDRVNNQSKICEPYAYFKNTIYEKRITVFESDLLTEEVLGLERNSNTGKVDHPDGGKFGSKDLSDAVCGSLWNAQKHADEYAFYYGEDIDTAITISNDSEQETRKELEINLTQELQELFSKPPQQQLFKQQEILDDDFYLMNGIIV